MICLDNTDVIEGGASVDAVIDYQIHGLVGTAFTQLAAGVLGTTLTTVLYTATAGISVVSIILVNTHTVAVDVTLRLDPADGGNPRYLIPKTVSLGPGYSLHSDGARIAVMGTNGELIFAYPSPLGPTKGGTGIISYNKADLIYASAANVLATLGIGPANYKLFVNSAGENLEYSSGMKLIHFTRDTSIASGDQPVTGVGHKPSHVIFLANIPGLSETSIGLDDGTLHFTLYNNHTVTANSWYSSTSYSMAFVQSGSIFYTGSITTRGADGFTITWSKTGAKTGIANIFAFVLR